MLFHARGNNRPGDGRLHRMKWNYLFHFLFEKCVFNGAASCTKTVDAKVSGWHKEFFVSKNQLRSTDNIKPWNCRERERRRESEIFFFFLSCESKWFSRGHFKACGEYERRRVTFATKAHLLRLRLHSLGGGGRRGKGAVRKRGRGKKGQWPGSSADWQAAGYWRLLFFNFGVLEKKKKKESSS